MIMLADIDCYGSILLIMALDIQLLLLVQLACIDCSCHILFTIAQHGQRVNVNVIVD